MLGCPVGIGHVDLNQEPVELRFRQGISAFLFDRILCGQHVKRSCKWAIFSGCGYLVFLHGLQER